MRILKATKTFFFTIIIFQKALIKIELKNSKASRTSMFHMNKKFAQEPNYKKIYLYILKLL